MEELFLFFLAFASSVGAYALAKRQGMSDFNGLYSAALTALECLGTAIVFLAFNVVIGTGIILVIRNATTMFVPVYAVSSPLLFVLSFVQGFVFQLWWRNDRRGTG
jgi:hypothetical protein